MKPHVPTLFYAFLIILVSIGLGRFSFGMILPNLQDNLHITTTQVGLISTSNFMGYFIGIFFVSSLYKKYETSNMLFTVILLQAFSMFFMVLTTHYLTAAICYTFTGFFSAIANVSIMVYIAHVIPQKLRGKALGIAVTGIGLGIILSGLLVPLTESFTQYASWKISWIIFASITIVVAFVVKKGISADTHKSDTNPNESFFILFKNSAFWKISFIYLIFGITYVIYVTYFVFSSIQKYDLLISQSGYFWSLLGFMSLVSGPLFGSIADKIGAYKTLIIVYALLTFANIILSLDVPAFMLVLSAITFGVSAWSIPSLVTLLTSIHFGKAKTAQVFSMITIIFAAGQTIGPVLSGYVYDRSQSFDFIFLLCALLCSFAMLCAFIFSKAKVT